MSGITVSWRKRIPNPAPMPLSHQHETDEDFPVVCFDFNKTITPALLYPIEAGPFPFVKEAMELLRARGCCLHVTTSGLYYGTMDLGIYQARKAQLQGFFDAYELPVQFIGGKVGSDCFYDDRMVEVPFETDQVDWQKIGQDIVDLLKERFTIGTDGNYHRKSGGAVGQRMEDFPALDEVPVEKPRGYSGPRLDVDIHKTLSQANSSTREALPNPGAVRAVTDFYNALITIRLSCAGWSPMTHSVRESNQRLAGLRQYMEKYGVPYDNIITKDHGDIYVDDKGIRAVDWEADVPRIMQKLKESKRNTPSLQWPA